MAEQTHALTVWRTEHSLLTLEDLARAAGLHPELVGRGNSWFPYSRRNAPDVLGLYRFSSLCPLDLWCLLRDVLSEPADA